MNGFKNNTLRVIIISGVTAFVVICAMAGAALGIYYLAFRETPPETGGVEGPAPILDRASKAVRSVTGSATDAAKVTSVSYGSWSHVGPLYPAPKDPPGFVSGSSVAFRRDLTASRLKKKDYDRDLPDEVMEESAILSPEQYEILAKACAENDIVNEGDSRNIRTEGGSGLTIEYDGQLKRIATSNMGNDSTAVGNVRAAMRRLENSLVWKRH